MTISLPVVPPAAPSGGASARPFDLPTRPADAHAHLFHTDHGPHILVVDGSQVFGLTDADAADFRHAAGDPAEVRRLLAAAGVPPPAPPAPPPVAPPVRALSLAVAQKCNLGCQYCYAQGGEFGGEPKAMSADTARAAVDRLLADARPGDRATLTFLGGEPLIARGVIRLATEYAATRAASTGVRLQFAITTNGTLLSPGDADFFERHGFAVTVSLDGMEEDHDRLRPFRGGGGSFARILANARPLLDAQKRMQVSARVTVTPLNMNLQATLDGLVDEGFHSVGFSPLLASPTGRGEMTAPALDAMLDQMTACGRKCERRLAAGRRYPFANLTTALKELHLGSNRSYPCGAGVGYFGVSADGDLAACHRFVGHPAGAMGDPTSGVDRLRQAEWLAARVVHTQEPCRGCWARHLCGGGCHHEVVARGRPACDFIRGWLHYCLQAYVRVLVARPDYFTHAR